jgi:pilus assembly protein CpaE
MLMHVDATIVRFDLKESEFLHKMEEILNSMPGFHLQKPGDSRRADLIILELDEEDVEKTFHHIQSLMETSAASEVFFTSRKHDPMLLLRAMRTGVKEFIPQPLKEDEFEQALERFQNRRARSSVQEPAKNGRIINVIGSKGGVGTTTIGVNLAISMAAVAKAQSIALLDMNLLFGEIPLFLELKSDYHWGKITKDISRLDPTFLMQIMARHSSGVYVLSSPSSLNGYPAPTPRTIDQLLSLMQTMFDVILIDSGQSLDETSLRILELSDVVLLVTLLSLPCLSNTKRLLSSFYHLGYPPIENIKILINRYLKDSEISLKDDLKDSEISLKDVETSINERVFWTIPNDYRTTISAINQGRTLAEYAERAPITKNIGELAAILSGEGNKKEIAKKDLLGSLIQKVAILSGEGNKKYRTWWRFFSRFQRPNIHPQDKEELRS